MKRIFFSVPFYLLLLGALGYGVYIGFQYAYIGSSYASKVACSCHFLSGRKLEDIKKNDLYAASFVSVAIDEQSQSVTSSVYGIAQTSAIYRKGLGCTLLNGTTAEKLRQQSKPFQRNPVPHFFERAKVADYFDSTLFYTLTDHAFLDSTHQLQTRALIVLKDGKLVYERYADGFMDTTRLTGWSMTKSVTNAMIGLLIKDGKLKIDQPAPIEEWKRDERKNITIDALLRMSSGLAFDEVYSKPSDATNMLFRSYSAAQSALECPATSAPLTVFSYSSGTTNILQEVIRRQFVSLESYHRFPYERLFDKIGMKSAVMEMDASGTFVGSSFMYATALDWARFGQFYLQEGQWNGEQVLPEGWTRYSSSETPHSDGKYAAHFWLNHPIKGYPYDGYYASGFEGQYINVLPTQGLVVVRLGCHRGQTKFDNGLFVKDLVAALKR